MTPRNLAIVWAPNLLRSGALVDEIRDIGAGSQLVELLVSEAPRLFQEAYRLLSERLRRVHERLSCDEGKQKLVWERSQKEDSQKRSCCDRSISGEEAPLCGRLYQSQQNIGHQSRYGLLCEVEQVESEEEGESKSERRIGGRLRGRNQRMGVGQVRRFTKSRSQIRDTVLSQSR